MGSVFCISEVSCHGVSFLIKALVERFRVHLRILRGQRLFSNNLRAPRFTLVSSKHRNGNWSISKRSGEEGLQASKGDTFFHHHQPSSIPTSSQLPQHHKKQMDRRRSPTNHGDGRKRPPTKSKSHVYTQLTSPNHPAPDHYSVHHPNTRWLWVSTWGCWHGLLKEP